MDLHSMLNSSVPGAAVSSRISTHATSTTTATPSVTTNTMPSPSTKANSIITAVINNSTPAPSANHNNNHNKTTQKDKAIQYQFNTTLQYLIAKDSSTNTVPTSRRSLLSSPFHPVQDGLNRSPHLDVPSNTTRTNCPRLGPQAAANPVCWKPKLSLKALMREQPITPAKRTREGDSPNNSLEFRLNVKEIILNPAGSEPEVLLEDSYEIQGSYPRGFFVLFSKNNITHNFIFEYPEHPWFDDLYGLRKSALIKMRTADGTLYELHLKPGREKKHLFGYLVKQDDMIRIVKKSMKEIIFQRKLPLVLDLDDTLVRLVGEVSEGNERRVPEADLPKCADRIAVLNDGNRVVLTERVHEFLEWAQNFYEISICSLGDQNYVENIVRILDPQGTRIRGLLYSARPEHDFIRKSGNPQRPSKDLLALYSFCALKDKSLGSAFSLPLILDDETRMWPTEQRDNIIQVTDQRNSPAWSVSLFPAVQDTLAYVHQEFFRQFDKYYEKFQDTEQPGYEPPSALGIYKTYLRHLLRDTIARGGSAPSASATTPNPLLPQ